jgi:hypothetical protein
VFLRRVKKGSQASSKSNSVDKEKVDRTKISCAGEIERMELRQREWNYLGSHSAWHTGYVKGVPRCEWHSSGSIPGGCAPCSATMLLGYLGTLGYGTLPHITWNSMGTDPDEDTLQNALEVAMGTNGAGTTWTFNIDNGNKRGTCRLSLFRVSGVEPLHRSSNRF